MYARGSNRFQTLIAQFADIASAVQSYLTAHPIDLSGCVQKETGKSLVADTEIAKIHEPESDNQDLSGKQDVLVSGTNIKTVNGNSLLGSGNIVISGGSDPWTVVKLAQDFTISTTANNTVTGFNFTPAANKTYLIFGYFLLRTATATVGARPGVAWPSGLTDATIRIEAANSVTASALRLFGARSTQNAASTGLATTVDSHWGSLDGIMITGPSVGGTVQITLASETAGTNVTMKAGSILMYREL